MKAHEVFIPWNEFKHKLELIESSLSANKADTLRALIQSLVSGYVSNTEVVDWVYLKQKEQHTQSGAVPHESLKAKT